MQIGFLRNEEPEEPAPAPAPESEPLSEEGMLLLFDGKLRGISFEAMKMHGMATGASGTGKTTKTAIPALAAAIPVIDELLFIDPKHTLEEAIRSKARDCGREDSMIVIGTIPSAQPVNIIEGMSGERFYGFVMDIFRRSMRGESHNMDFHSSAVGMARDVFLMLKGINELCRANRSKLGDVPLEATSPTLPRIAELLADYKQATALFQKYRKAAERTPEFLRFEKRVTTSLYHPMNQTEEISDSDHRNHVAWNTEAAIKAITGFIEEDGIAEKFCRPGAPGLNFDDIKGRIILVSFGPGSGPAAASICRLVIEAVYARIYRDGVGGPLKMIICDEYHEVADLSGGKLSDVNFLALAREYNCGCFFITQSYSGLAARYGEAGLDALIGNIANKIFLHSEDPLTRAAARSAGGPDPIELDDDCFASTYDADRREYSYGIESLNEAYAKGQAIPPAKAAPCEVPPADQGLEGMEKALDLLVAERERWEKEEAARRALEVAAQYSCAESQEENEKWKQAVKDMNDEDKAMRHMEKREPQDDPFSDFYEPEPVIPASAPEPVYAPDDLRSLYPDSFDRNAVVRVPAGFRHLAGQALELMTSMELPVSLSRLAFSHLEPCRFEAKGTPNGSVTVLNRLLSATKCACANCGQTIEPNYFNLCNACMATFPKTVISRHKAAKESKNASANAIRKD